jgi:hypothetical protein
VFNNLAQLDDMLLRSLGRITPPDCVINKLLIDNTQRKYKSCAEAYNQELEQHWSELGSILVFCHQDIAFCNDAFFLARIVLELSSNPNQVLGFAGMPQGGRTVSNLQYLNTKQFITRTQVAEKTEVCSLDECCFAMTRDMYQQIRFDEVVCNHWHLYAADFCYAARRALNAKSYVLPEIIYHKYDGSSGLYVDNDFVRTMWKMTRKYHRDFATIDTSCYVVSTQLFPSLLELSKTYVKNLRYCYGGRKSGK